MTLASLGVEAMTKYYSSLPEEGLTSKLVLSDPVQPGKHVRLTPHSKAVSAVRKYFTLGGCCSPTSKIFLFGRGVVIPEITTAFLCTE